jgi:hypothetical protein
MRFRNLLAILLPRLVLGAAGCLPLSAHAAEQVNFFVASAGNDANGGRAKGDALRTLEAVQQKVASIPKAADPLQVTIFVEAGRYFDQTLEWTTARPNLSVTLRPYEGTAEGQVIFDGTKSKKRQFFAYDPSKASPVEQSGTVRFSFEGVVVENFCEGLSFGDVGGRSPTSGHRVDRVTLRSIGSKYDRRMRPNEGGTRLPLGDCVAGIRLSATSGTTITRSLFENIENLPSNQTFYRKYGPGLLHAIYISSSARGNSIVENRFVGFTGSPVRIRDRSDDTIIKGNVFERPLWPDDKVKERPLYAVSEWYCNTAVPACIEKARQGERECPSTGTNMAGNQLGSGIKSFADESQSKESTCTVDPKKLR